MVYRGLVESILSFHIVTWYDHVTVKNKASLARIVNTAGELICRDQGQLSNLYSVTLKRKDTQIFGNPDGLLTSAFETLPSGRRKKVPLARKPFVKQSFILSASAVLNGVICLPLPFQMEVLMICFQ